MRSINFYLFTWSFFAHSVSCMYAFPRESCKSSLLHLFIPSYLYCCDVFVKSVHCFNHTQNTVCKGLYDNNGCYNRPLKAVF